MPVRNVLLLLTDQHRAAATGFAGDPLASTPNLDGLAARSTVFTRAYTPAPLCVPARQSLLTGRYPHAHGATGNARPMHQGETTIGHLAAAHGLTTAAIGKMHFVGPDRHQGFATRWDYEDYAREQPLAAGDAASGMAYVDCYGRRAPDADLPTLPATNPLNRAYLSGPSPFPAEQHIESYVTRETIRYLERQRDERFLLICSYWKPHDPMTPPEPYWERFAHADIPLPAQIEEVPSGVQRMQGALGVEGFDPDAWRNAVRGYYGNLAFVDAQIGTVLDAVRALGLLDDTLIIYASDHGEMTGVLPLAGKLCFYEPAWRVPLLISHPAPRAPFATCDALVSLIDLFPTIVDALGLAPESASARLHGATLLPHITGDPAPPARHHVYGELHPRNASRPYRAIRTHDWKLALYEPGEEQLFDLRLDPGERHNVHADHPARAAELERLMPSTSRA
ncbi:MAG TPA: sulfatase-like hydrolase/transferase [Chloroflexota bacterium]|nr:sulfatase-like hydrolase/transferase [Chloroflexota bacterium]